MVKKAMFCALPTIVTIELEVAVPSVGDCIVISGPSSNLRASKSPYPTTKSIAAIISTRFMRALYQQMDWSRVATERPYQREEAAMTYELKWGERRMLPSNRSGYVQEAV